MRELVQDETGIACAALEPSFSAKLFGLPGRSGDRAWRRRHTRSSAREPVRLRPRTQSGG
jgi:hypothetical protein